MNILLSNLAQVLLSQHHSECFWYVMTHFTTSFLCWNYYGILLDHDEFWPSSGPNTLFISLSYFISY